MGGERDKLLGRHGSSGERTCRPASSGRAASVPRHRTRWPAASRVIGTELGGERRHIQAEDGEGEAAIGGRAGNPGGPGRRSGLHHVSSLGVGVLPRESYPQYRTKVLYMQADAPSHCWCAGARAAGCESGQCGRSHRRGRRRLWFRQEQCRRQARAGVTSAEASEWLSVRREDRRSRRRWWIQRLKERAHTRRCLVPEGACPPFVALAMQADQWVVTEIEVFNAQIGGLLNTRSGVVEEEQEGPV